MKTLREWRIERGWTQGELATAIGASQRSISAWERGEKEPGISKVRAIADALKVPVGDITFAANGHE